ncbi:MAG: type VI secretion system baseplate subunit TssF [Roseivivax sp.]|nr:type VI secretion system baseplate subunit TssF [Roseivivax sp.]
MDSRLLRYYENELAYMREMGAEFARAYPKIAARLGMEGFEILDPYVERLLEGSAFLAARVQLELDMQFPAMTSHLLEIVYPHYLCPTPSMMIAQLEPDLTGDSLADGHRIERGSALVSQLTEGQRTPCEFRTAMDMVLWPVEIAEAEYIDGRGALVSAGLTGGTEARAAIRLRLRRPGGAPLSEVAMDRLTLFLDPRGHNAWHLHELLCVQSLGLVARSTDRRADWALPLPVGAVVPRGFDADEALLPTPRRSFDGYRLLQEYFAMPERFLFCELQGLRPALNKAAGDVVDLYILLREGSKSAEAMIKPEAFTLNAVPAVNLFPKRLDRVPVHVRDTELHVVPDRTAGLDYEVHTIQSVVGIQEGDLPDIDFRPFYSATDLTAAGESWGSYYTLRRRMRERSEKERLRGVRTTYLGSEVYLSLVDRSQAPFSARLEQLAVQAMCSNRDLPLLLAAGSGGVFDLAVGGPVKTIRTPVPPTRPHPTLAQGDRAWRLISHLSLNYLSIAESGKGEAAEALRELLGIYAPLANRVAEKQLEGIVSVNSRPIVRRMADEVLSTAVRGVEITVGFDESRFEGTSVYVLGSVLERFFRKYVSINSFTETVLKTDRRGEIVRWRPASGLGRMI